MKVLIISNGTGGIYGFRKELVSELIKENEIIIASRLSGYEQELKNIGCKVIDTEMDRRGMNFFKEISLFLNYKKLLKKCHPDLVITYTIKPNIYGSLACRIQKIPYAVNITGLGTAFQKQGMLRNLVIAMYKVSLKKAKVVFFENCENQQIFLDEKIIQPEQACLLNGAGVNLEHFAYAEYPADDEITRFLFIGRVMKEKGIDELFEAMKLLQKDGIACTLDVLGGYEEDYKSVIEKYQQEGWLHYHGYQKDVRSFIKNCHCFVLPSWHEGMANTNLESASMGRPVITSNIHGCLEAVIDRESGFLCEKQNPESLYTVMKKFTQLPYEKRKMMGISGRKHMEKVFDKKRVVEETMAKIYR